MKKIIYVLGTLGAGGAERLIFDLATKLSKNTWKVSIVGLGHFYDRKFEERMVNFLEERDIKVFVVEKGIHKDRLRTILRLRKIVKAVKPDLIHAHLFPGRFYSAISTYGLSIPMLTTYHNTNGFDLKREKQLSKRFSYVIAVSETVKKFVKENLKIDEKKIKVIYNGVDTKRFKRIEKIPHSNIIFASVGRLVPQKGYILLIKAVEKLRDADNRICENVLFRIAGDGPMRIQLQSMVRKKRISNCFEFLGNINDVPKLFSQSDVFIAPSTYEGFGIALVEAMSSGKAVISSDIQVFKEILHIDQQKEESSFFSTNYGVMFKSGNSDALAQAIKWIIENKNKWPEFSKNAKMLAERYDISETVKQHEELYSHILSTY